MEEVWKDINVSTLRTPSSTTDSNFPELVFHDLSARNPQTRVTLTPTETEPSILSLNSGSGFDFQLHNKNKKNLTPLVSNSSVFCTNMKKKILEINDDNDPSVRGKKRMIKNRESAARSRARRQAYANQLENEVAQLQEENAKLKRQQKKFYFQALVQLPKKHALCRTITAPF